MSDEQSPPVFDVESLLQPIPGDAPGGVDLRADSSPTSPYYAIKDARNTARAVERQLLMDPGATVEPPDWGRVLTLAPKLLAEKSKDLEIVAWYVEALIREHGFAGLRDGFRLARELCERNWDALFPLPDEEGVVTRVAPLTGLNGDDAEGTLIAPIRFVAMATGPAGERWGQWEFEKAGELDRLPAEEREAKAAEGGVTMQAFEAAVRGAGPAFYRTLLADLTAAKDEFAKLAASLDAKCGGSAPPSSNIRAALDKYEEVLRFAARNHLAESGGAAASADAPGASRAGAAGGGGGASGPLRSREDAFRQLEAVADFFRQTEPHSPLSYTLQQAVRWGRMPLPELLTELIPDEGTRAQLFRLTGLRVPEPPAATPPAAG